MVCNICGQPTPEKVRSSDHYSSGHEGAQPATYADLGVSKQRVAEWREVRDAGEEVVETVISSCCTSFIPPISGISYPGDGGTEAPEIRAQRAQAYADDVVARAEAAAQKAAAEREAARRSWRNLWGWL